MATIMKICCWCAAVVYLSLLLGVQGQTTELNFARGRQTWQGPSSFVPPNLAVDGNRDSNFTDGSCTRTADNGVNPWWAVDLGRPANVRKVVFYNRQDCCPDRANDFIVGLTNVSPADQSPTVGNYTLCGQHAGPVGTVETVNCSAVSAAARYVIVQLNRTGILSICELEVYELQVNIARGQPTWQSSNYPINALPDRAVDGNRDSNYSHNSCTRLAENQTNPWWAVDLGRPTYVGKVVFYNRQDCCAERANDFIVGLTNVSPADQSPTVGSYTLCGQYAGLAGAVATVNCSTSSPAARYVIVQLNRIGTLTICELEVYGVYGCVYWTGPTYANYDGGTSRGMFNLTACQQLCVSEPACVAIEYTIVSGWDTTCWTFIQLDKVNGAGHYPHYDLNRTCPAIERTTSTAPVTTITTSVTTKSPATNGTTSTPATSTTRVATIKSPTTNVTSTSTTSLSATSSSPQISTSPIDSSAENSTATKIEIVRTEVTTSGSTSALSTLAFCTEEQCMKYSTADSKPDRTVAAIVLGVLFGVALLCNILLLVLLIKARHVNKKNARPSGVDRVVEYETFPGTFDDKQSDAVTVEKQYEELNTKTLNETQPAGYEELRHKHTKHS